RSGPGVLRRQHRAPPRRRAAGGRRASLVLSIVGVDRVEGTAHFAGKRCQEELVQAGPIPATIVRATQFHEFAAMVVGWTRHGDVAAVPPLLVQPVAASDVGQVLAEIATGAPDNRVLELAGPDTQDLVDMARRTLAARGQSVRLVPSWRPFGVDMAGEVLLPGPDAQLAPTTFDAWLAAETGRRD
ncbi:MAG: SDR family oxidoreductase, partial [Pseudonocardiaceae bacterium]